MIKKLFLDTEQESWDFLTDKAENIFEEEFEDSFIVGIYPCGEKLYGIRSSNPKILVLYMEETKKLLNPTYKREISYPYVLSSYSDIHYDITYLNLFDWAKMVTDFNSIYNTNLFLEFIPVFGDILYQDSILDTLYAKAENYLLTFKNSLISLAQINDISLVSALYTRSLYLFNQIGIFNPNVNNDFNIITKLESITNNKQLLNLDTEIIKIIKNNSINELSFSMLSSYINNINNELKLNINIKTKQNTKEKEDFINEIIKIYTMTL